MIIPEGKLDVEFAKQYRVVKFDKTNFYTCFKSLDGAKGVDFIALSDNDILFLEIKDCKGHESENEWRIFPENLRRSFAQNKRHVLFSLKICPHRRRNTMKCDVGLHDILHVSDVLKILAKESLYGIHNEFRTAVFICYE